MISFVSASCKRFFFQEKRGKNLISLVSIQNFCFHIIKNLIIVNNNEDCITDIVREGPCVPKLISNCE